MYDKLLTALIQARHRQNGGKAKPAPKGWESLSAALVICDDGVVRAVKPGCAKHMNVIPFPVKKDA